MDKRQIIKSKSVYAKKPEGWNFMDEIQYQWVMLRAEMQDVPRFGKIRKNVQKRLKQNGKLHTVFNMHGGKRNYVWIKKR